MVQLNPIETGVTFGFQVVRILLFQAFTVSILQTNLGLSDVPDQFEDSGALKASTCTTVLAYTAPFASEMADTMKDWVVTGICILHAETWIGFLIGAAIVGIEAAAIMIGLIPDQSHFSYSFILLLVTWQGIGHVLSMLNFDGYVVKPPSCQK